MRDPTENAAFIFNMLYHVNSDRNVTPAARSVYLWLTYHLPNCYPSLKQLARLTGFTEKTVGNAIHNLVAAGYIEVDRQHRANNDYTAVEREKWSYEPFKISRSEAGKNYPNAVGLANPQQNVRVKFTPKVG
jgi:hypothetical protein